MSQYDEVLEVSVSEVLHRALIAGIGERQEGNAPNPTAPCTEIPSIGTMFSAVKKVRSLFQWSTAFSRLRAFAVVLSSSGRWGRERSPV